MAHRGWTLQELLAPAFLIFVSQEWRPIGTKSEHATLLQEISGIHAKYLTHQWTFNDNRTNPISRRMAWASRRSTTRPEDEAYCLLGLFDITLPILYGEGRRAFQRLQEELVKRSPGTTIFIWEQCLHLQYSTVPPVPSEEYFDKTPNIWHFGFAPSPRQFDGWQGALFTPMLFPELGVQPYMRHQWPDEVSQCTRAWYISKACF